MRAPELGGVADRLGDLKGLPERVLRFLPPASRGRDFAREPPTLHEVLARIRPRGEFEAAAGVRGGLVEVAPRERQLAEARVEPDRVAEFHPGARLGIARESFYPVE